MAEHGLTRPFSAAIMRARGAEKLIALGMVCLLLTAAVAGVSGVLIGPDWNSLWKGLFLGLVTGWSLAIFRQPAWRSASILLATGLLFTLLIPAGLGGKLMPVISALVNLAAQALLSTYNTPLDITPLAYQFGALSTAVVIILGRVQVWISALAAGQPAFDPVAAALVWNLGVWILAAWAGWVVEARRNALLAVFPAVLLSVGTLSYGQSHSVVLYLMLAATLLLLATVQHDQREREWDRTGAAYPKRKGRQIGLVALVVTLLLVFLSGGISSLSLQRVAEWLARPSKPSDQADIGLAKSLGIKPASTQPVDRFSVLRQPGLPQDHLIGSGPELSRRVVMTIAVENLAAITQAGQIPVFYWRSLTYDSYTGHGWRSSATSEKSYPPEQALQPEHASDHILVQQVVRPVETGNGLVYAAGEPVRVNTSSLAAWRSDGDLFGLHIDSSLPYQAQSLAPVASENELRAAGQVYPDWIRQRYLALPAELPSRVKELAIQLTASQATPYDRAHAIEGYLRTFPYTLDVSRPPQDRDVVDYFLFDIKKGYCDYYASAMVVLARAAGVPARLAVGYANGTYNLNSKRFVITEADAHSWVEVYFPKIGWVPFEPTAARPALNQAASSAAVQTQITVPPAVLPSTNSVSTPAWGWLIVLAGLVTAAIFGGAWLAYGALRLRRLPETYQAVEIYSLLQGQGEALHVVKELGDTPYEYMARLISRLGTLSDRGMNPGLCRLAVEEVTELIDEIVITSFRSTPVANGGEVQLIPHWRILRRHLRIIRVLYSWYELRNRLLQPVGAAIEAG